MNQKKYFKKKRQAVQYQIWDFDFKKEKTLEIREGIRQEYDGALARLATVEAQIKSLPEDQTKWTDEQKHLLDTKALLLRDIEGEKNGDGSIARAGYKDILKSMDLEVYGSGKTNEYPDGVNGIDQQLDALRDLYGKLTNYIKTL